MKARLLVHGSAILFLLIMALQNVIGTIRTTLETMPFRTNPWFIQTAPAYLAAGIWGPLIWDVWTRPRKWSLGVAIFLIFVIVFQTCLWRLAVVRPDHARLGLASTPVGFFVYETPVAVAAICCLLLSFMPSAPKPET